jgi:hypothetical protein
MPHEWEVRAVRGRRGLVWAAVVVAVSLLVSACGSATATPTYSPVAAPSTGLGATPTPGTAESPASVATTETPTGATPTATTAATLTLAPTSLVNGFYLRAWTVAPIGMANTFSVAPRVISDAKMLTVTYPPASGNPPLYAPPSSRTISAAGLATIVAEAQSDGLLGKSTDFVCPHSADSGMIAGSGVDHLVLIVGGVSHEMSSSCPYPQPTPGTGKPAPATWAAFERFKELLADPSAWLGSAVGPATGYTPDSLAVLLTIHDPVAESFSPVNVTQWPLTTPLASFGIEVAGMRCGVVSGKDAATLLPVVKSAPGETMFRDGADSYADLVVRAFMPGEPSPCVGY